MNNDELVLKIRAQLKADEAQEKANFERILSNGDDYLKRHVIGKGKTLAEDSPFGVVYDGDTTHDYEGGKRELGGNTSERKSKGTGAAQPLSIEAQQRFRELLNSGKYEEQSNGKRGYYGRLLTSHVDKDGNTAMDQLIAEGYAAPTRYDGDDATWAAQGSAMNAQFEALDRRAKTGSSPALDESLDYTINDPVLTTTQGKDYRGPVKRAWARGSDNTQMHIYQFGELVGETAGFDLMKEWGEEGVIRNMREAAESPADIATSDDIESINDLGTYILEKTVENTPNLLIDLGVGTAAAAAVIATGGAAAPLVAPAIVQGIGKSFIQKVGWRGAGKFGVGSSMYTQMTGEARHSQLEQGVDNPLLAYTVGGVNTALEFKGMQSMLKGFMPTGKITNASAMAKHIAQRAVVSTGIEGGTEFLQDLNTQLSIKLSKPNYEIDWDQLTESFFAGAAAGGGTGTVSATAGGSYGLMKTIGENVQTRRAMDGTTPEAPVQIQAQLANITDPNTSLDAVYAADPEAADKVTLPEGVIAYNHESGVLFTTNEAKGKAFEQDGNKDAKATLGYLETKEEVMANTKVEDLRSVVARDADGVAVGTEMTSVANAPNVEASMRKRYGKDVDISTLNTEQTKAVLTERQELFNEDIRVRAEERKGLNPEGGQVNTNEAAPAQWKCQQIKRVSQQKAKALSRCVMMQVSCVL